MSIEDEETSETEAQVRTRYDCFKCYESFWDVRWVPVTKEGHIVRSEVMGKRCPKCEEKAWTEGLRSRK